MNVLGDWTVDVCVLKYSDHDFETSLNCQHFILSFIKKNFYKKKEQFICVDKSGKILDSYKKHVNMKNPSDIIGKWLSSLCRYRTKIRVLYPDLNRKQKKKLLELGFHDDDLIYVEVANVSQKKRIVSVDTDFGCNPKKEKNRVDIREFINEQIGVSIYTPNEASEILKR